MKNSVTNRDPLYNTNHINTTIKVSGKIKELTNATTLKTEKIVTKLRKSLNFWILIQYSSLILFITLSSPQIHAKHMVGPKKVMSNMGDEHRIRTLNYPINIYNILSFA